MQRNFYTFDIGIKYKHVRNRTLSNETTRNSTAYLIDGLRFNFSRHERITCFGRCQVMVSSWTGYSNGTNM